MVNHNRVAYLYSRYKESNLSGDEEKEWQKLLQDTSYDEVLKNLITEDWTHLDRKKLKKIPALRAGQLLEVILTVPQERKEIPVRDVEVQHGKIVRMTSWRYKVAIWGTAILMLSLGLWWTMDTLKKEERTSLVEVQDIMPGGNRALLTLANGRTIDLSETKDGITVSEGHIYYLDGNQTVLFDDLPIGWNTLSTPNGGQYRVDLPDGTKVWLNSASSLRYPSRFDPEKRIVELEGEAYFEVVHAKAGKRVPFMVKARDQQIEVLGTSFSVSAYSNEPYMSSVLVEGKVKLVTKNGKSHILKPNEKIKLWLSTELIELDKIEAKDAVSWKDGMFYFDNTDLKEAMRTIGRWYDVEFVLDSLPEKRINGVLPKNIKLYDLISILSETTGLALTYSLEKNNQHKTRRVFMKH